MASRPPFELESALPSKLSARKWGNASQDTANSSTLAEVTSSAFHPHKLVLSQQTTVSCGDLSQNHFIYWGMTNEDTQYHITIKGHLDASSWQDWFDGFNHHPD